MKEICKKIAVKKIEQSPVILRNKTITNCFTFKVESFNENVCCQSFLISIHVF